MRRPSRHDPGDDEPWIDAADGRREWREVLGAYFLLHPLASIRVLFFLGVIPIVAHVPALIVLRLWFATQIASATCYLISEPGVAVWAHVGGFITGIVLVPVFRQSSVQLLQPRRSRPSQLERRRGPWS